MGGEGQEHVAALGASAAPSETGQPVAAIAYRSDEAEAAGGPRYRDVALEFCLPPHSIPISRRRPGADRTGEARPD